MDVSQYLSMFIEESKEHLQSLNEQLLILEKEPDNNETINEIFRAAHSLKGMAPLLLNWVFQPSNLLASFKYAMDAVGAISLYLSI